jgi:hypothetical protein
LQVYAGCPIGLFWHKNDLRQVGCGDKIIPELKEKYICTVNLINIYLEGAKIEQLKRFERILKAITLFSDSQLSCHQWPSHMAKKEIILLDMGYNFEATNPQHLNAYAWKK